jgi:hypothetical protein
LFYIIDLFQQQRLPPSFLLDLQRDPGFVAEEGEVDIDGEPRVMGGRVDMGADEVGEKQADFTRDGRIDISDLSVLGGSWGTAEGEVFRPDYLLEQPLGVE